MSDIFYLIGLAIGVVIFIYLYVAFQSGKDKYKARAGQKSRLEKSVNPDFVDYFALKRPPGVRLCPLCGKGLTKYEALYASNIEEKGKKMILIHGCRYCYKSDKE
jgi:hypothetical protein